MTFFSCACHGLYTKHERILCGLCRSAMRHGFVLFSLCFRADALTSCACGSGLAGRLVGVCSDAWTCGISESCNSSNSPSSSLIPATFRVGRLGGIGDMRGHGGTSVLLSMRLSASAAATAVTLPAYRRVLQRESASQEKSETYCYSYIAGPP